MPEISEQERVAIAAVVDAVANVGPGPHIHARALDHLSAQWPTLYRALSALLLAKGLSMYEIHEAAHHGRSLRTAPDVR